MQGLRAKNNVYIRCAFDDFSAFLTGDTAAHANFHATRFQVLDAPQIAKYFLLCFFAYGAGIEQNQIGFFGVVSFFVALGSTKHIGHFVGVVLVHLAAKGFDVDLFWVILFLGEKIHSMRWARADTRHCSQRFCNRKYGCNDSYQMPQPAKSQCRQCALKKSVREFGQLVIWG